MAPAGSAVRLALQMFAIRRLADMPCLVGHVQFVLLSGHDLAISKSARSGHYPNVPEFWNWGPENVYDSDRLMYQ